MERDGHDSDLWVCTYIRTEFGRGLVEASEDSSSLWYTVFLFSWADFECMLMVAEQQGYFLHIFYHVSPFKLAQVDHTMIATVSNVRTVIVRYNIGWDRQAIIL